MENSDFKFIGYRLVNFNFNVNDEFNIKPEELEINTQVSTIISPDNNRLAEIHLDVSLKTKLDTLQINLKIKGLFEGGKLMPDDIFTIMVNQNAPAVLYPFARAIISSYTIQANIPPIVLPLINFQSKK